LSERHQHAEADPKKARLKALALKLMARPTSVELGLTCLWFALAVVAVTDAAVGFSYFLTLSFGLMVLGSIWVLRGAITLIQVFARARHRGKLVLTIFSWLALPGVVFCSAGLAWHKIGLKLRVRMSEPALAEFVRTVEPGSNQIFDGSGKCVGLFRILEAENTAGCVRFITTQEFLDHAGLAHCPEGEPPVMGEDCYRHLYGPWWHWYRSW